MTLIPDDLAQSQSFIDDLRALVALPLAELEELTKLAVSRSPSDSTPPLDALKSIAARAAADVGSVRRSYVTARFLAFRGVGADISVEESIEELAELLAMNELPQAGLTPLFRSDTLLARQATAARAFESGPNYSTSSFEPTLRLVKSEGGYALAQGVQASIQFFDPDGDVREFGFALTTWEAERLVDQITQALTEVRSLQPLNLQILSDGDDI